MKKDILKVLKTTKVGHGRVKNPKAEKMVTQGMKISSSHEQHVNRGYHNRMDSMMKKG